METNNTTYYVIHPSKGLIPFVSDFATKQEVRDALATLDSALKPAVVDKLPDSGEIGVIYFVSNASSGNGLNDYCDEYVWVNGRFELIGHTSVDLSDYTTTEQTAELSKSVAEHTENSDIHVTAQQKEEWDAKVDKSYAAGNFVDFTSDQTITGAKTFGRTYFNGIMMFGKNGYLRLEENRFIDLAGTGSNLALEGDNSRINFKNPTSYITGFPTFSNATATVNSDSILTVSKVQTDASKYSEEQLANQVLPKSYIEANFQEKGDYATSDELKDAVASTDAKVDEAKEAIATTDAKVDSSISSLKESIATTKEDLEYYSLKLASLMSPVRKIGFTYTRGMESASSNVSSFNLPTYAYTQFSFKDWNDTTTINYGQPHSSYFTSGPIRELSSNFLKIPIYAGEYSGYPLRFGCGMGWGCSGTHIQSTVKDITTDFTYVPVRESDGYVYIYGRELIDIVLFATPIDETKDKSNDNPLRTEVIVRHVVNGSWVLERNVIKTQNCDQYNTNRINRNGFSNLYFVLDSTDTIHIYTDSWTKDGKLFAKVGEYYQSGAHLEGLWWRYSNFLPFSFIRASFQLAPNEFYAGDGDEFLRCMEALSYNAVIEKTTEPYVPTIPKDDEEEESEES